ncbi:hypothetical protein IW262DRAFT_993938 [Armillaria fumosa]|nr:hypothetical protein IW262DRAFT_993938 [Armillaria fumosa]
MTEPAFSKREGLKRTPQPRSPDVSEHANQSNTTSQASVPLESGFQQIPPPSFSTFLNLHLGYSPPPTVYLTGPLELDEADYGTYSNTVGRERRALGTRYSNTARRTAFVPDDWIETILESTSDVLPETDAPTFGSKSSPSPNLLPVPPRMRSPRTLGLIDELTDTMVMDALHLGPVTQPSSPSLDPGVIHNGQISRDSQTLSLSPSQSFASQSSSQSSETSLGSVGYKSALIQLRDTLRPLTNLLWSLDVRVVMRCCSNRVTYLSLVLRLPTCKNYGLALHADLNMYSWFVLVVYNHTAKAAAKGSGYLTKAVLGLGLL